MQRPSDLGLMLCDHVLFEHRTLKPTLVGIFTTLASEAFPSVPRPIDVFAALTDGQGRMVLDLVVTRLDMDQQISAQSIEQEFLDPLQVVNVCFRFRSLAFPEAGHYLFQLLAEGRRSATGGCAFGPWRTNTHEPTISSGAAALDGVPG
jgi:hypothetical protein